MTALYNEIEPYAARWLRNLIASGHIADGAVDERSIKELAPADVAGPGQRHFFAGIAGWSLALRLAGVPDDADVWTGSCPCQPFSDAGRGGGFDDERHLWPVWFRLIRECRPPVVFGEQVASAAGLAWLDAVHADMEGEGYTVRAADLCAAGVGAPHRRQRLWFVAFSDTGRRWAARQSGVGRAMGRGADTGVSSEAANPGVSGGQPRGVLADPCSAGLEVRGEQQARGQLATTERGGAAVSMADTSRGGRGEGFDSGQAGAHRGAGSADGGWAGCDWIPCSDGVARPVEPGTHPLAHGVPARVGKLRAYGNAIVPQVAAAFIRAALDSIP